MVSNDFNHLHFAKQTPHKRLSAFALMVSHRSRLAFRSAVITSVTAGLVAAATALQPAQAQNTPYCQQTGAAIAQKEKLRVEAVKGNADAQKKYKALLVQQGDRLRKCRTQTWPQNQAIWIRLYACDAKPGVLEAVLDRIVDRGYNQVYVEAFYTGRALLPVNQNTTPWLSTLAGSGADNVDLLAQAIQKGRARGLKVYAWMFGMNFGANYVRRFDRQQTLAKNGLGQTSLTANVLPGLSTDLGQLTPDEVFVDPYSPRARQDYSALIAAIAQRKPDGILFDYIRYPRGTGSASVASKVQDLWVYGDASQQTLLQRAQNPSGVELLRRFLQYGFLKASDLKETNSVKGLTPQLAEQRPVWQGIDTSQIPANLPTAKQATLFQAELWRLAVAHAGQGVIDFVNEATGNVQNRGMPAGVVFFPDGNLTIGQGYDSRLQLWDRFPATSEWHPMAYGVCGNTSCIMQQIQRVLSRAPVGVQVKPVLAGVWQKSVGNRPPLETQMQVLYRLAPQLTSVSHFAYSWQEPGSDRDRKACTVRP
ncbi:family 10 glycosylhydrolase [Leptolyngbya sp. Cla-17]|uniref:family 10 glycosylhydrolase n=1 Tax=Leptolyngbya sp. Cla-17 TaxID=2803751 RepID=UPI0018D7E835|nr:family 10 glycosylhydrolase [Leptolyngbya sp. Cla-17]